MNRSSRLRVRLAIVFSCALIPGSLAGEDEHEAHRGHRRGSYTHQMVEYEIPEVRLVSTDGAEVGLQELLETENPVMLQFIFTTCTTICPILSATFGGVLAELGEEAGDLRMISISI